MRKRRILLVDDEGGYPFLAKPVHLETVLAFVDAHARERV